MAQEVRKEVGAPQAYDVKLVTTASYDENGAQTSSRYQQCCIHTLDAGQPERSRASTA